MLQFIDQNPVITVILLVFALQGLTAIVNRLVRATVVLCRGWPPPHLDADGDRIKKKHRPIEVDRVEQKQWYPGKPQ